MVFTGGIAMASTPHPIRHDEHRLWLFPDSRLERWVIGVFVAALLLGLSFPMFTPLLERLTGASHRETMFVTPAPYSMILAGVS
jgi:hypothetical protein